MGQLQGTGLAGRRVLRWLFRAGLIFAFLATCGWALRDRAVGGGTLAGFGELRVLGVTAGRDHEVPGRPGLLLLLPESWKVGAARELGYRDIVWHAHSQTDEVLLWCEWNLTNTLSPGGWFETVLIHPQGPTALTGNFPVAGYALGRHVEPIRFRATNLPPGSFLEIRRFQPGYPYRDLVARVALPQF
jgi:hypothetical protein